MPSKSTAFPLFQLKCSLARSARGLARVTRCPGNECGAPRGEGRGGDCSNAVGFYPVSVLLAPGAELRLPAPKRRLAGPRDD